MPPSASRSGCNTPQAAAFRFRQSECGYVTANAEDLVNRLRSIPGFDRVRFVILYGSVAEGTATAGSDIDICIYYDGAAEEAGEFRFRALQELGSDYDVQIFQTLPLYIRTRVFGGKVLYTTSLDFLYDVAYDTTREYEHFERILFDYIGKEAIT